MSDNKERPSYKIKRYNKSKDESFVIYQHNKLSKVLKAIENLTNVFIEDYNGNPIIAKLI